MLGRVPCDRVALAVLEDAGVAAEPVSLEADIHATFDKVTSGEADAGLVYASDAVAAATGRRRGDSPLQMKSWRPTSSRAGAVRGHRPRR